MFRRHSLVLRTHARTQVSLSSNARDGGTPQHAFLYLVKYGDSYEEHVEWEELERTLLTIRSPSVRYTDGLCYHTYVYPWTHTTLNWRS